MIRLLALCVLLLGLSVTGQENGDQGPYFSLTSTRTWLPGEKASVEVAASQVDALDFRLYRVKDPVRFFAQLEDVNRFGGRAPAPRRKHAAIERFHAFKRRTQTAMREFFRGQFSQRARTQLRALAGGTPPRKIERVTGYAETPVLNPDQVVSVWRQPVTAGPRWQTRNIPVATPGKGVFLLEAYYKDLRAYTFLVVSDLAMITAAAPGRLVAMVADRSTGTPVPRCTVMVKTGQEPFENLLTNADGMLDVTLKSEHPENVLLLARRGDDWAVHAPSSYFLSTDPGRYTVGYVYTDRPVYRPGHTVHFKAILRTQAGNEYRLPESSSVSARIEDPEGRVVFQKPLRLSAVGSVTGDLTLPPMAALGYYGIELRAGPSSVHGGFEVEEYKKPEYEVRVTTETRRVLQGDGISMLIEARYYFGEPVAHAKVTWVTFRARHWGPLEEPGGDEEDAGEATWMGEQIDEQTGRLDADGKLAIRVPTQQGSYDAVYRVQARVTDEANREISGMGYALATRGSFSINVTPARYIWQPGDRARFEVAARDYDGNPVRTPVRLEMRRAVRRKGPQADQMPVLSTAEVTTDTSGKAAAEMVIPDSGSFAVTASAHTPEKREVTASSYVWAGGASRGEDRERVEIVPDRKSYRPGDVARLLLVTGVPKAHVLFSVEGRRIESAYVIEVTGSSITVDVPVRADHQPGFYVSAAFLRGNRFYEGTRYIKVPPIERKLNVEVQSSKSEFKPGEPAEYTIVARDSEGRPVSAEFSLGVVDEAIYGVRKDMTPDILSFFYGRAYNRAGHESSLDYHFTGEAGKRRMLLTSIRPRGALAQLKPERLAQPRVRRAFPDTIYWAGDLTTDASGRARARLEFPDSLTTWRATARGVTRDTRVGNAIAKTTVRKNLVLRLTAPRFFTEGDEMTVSALVHNYLPAETKVRISLDVKGLTMLGGAAREVSVPSRGDARLDFRVRASARGEAILLGKALAAQESDALEITVPIRSYGVKLSQARSGTGAASFDMAIPASATPTSRRLRIAVTPSVAGSIFSALEFLTSFPYGCTEQTMSSFLPNLMVARALGQLNVPSAVDAALLRRQINAGMTRLREYQHKDGGWGWWQTDDSDTFMTAYVLSGLAQANAAGYTYPPYFTARAVEWLRAHPGQGDLAAFSSYALALHGGRPLEGPWNQRAALTSYGLALLGLALDAAGDPRAAQVAAQLEGKARSAGDEAWWPVDRDNLLGLTSEASAEATAYALKLLAKTHPQSPLLDKAAAWLVAHRREGGWWDSTKQTATVVYGLTDYLKRTGELRPSLTASVLVNGREVLSEKFTAADALAPLPKSVELDAAAANHVEVRVSGQGRLYWSVRTEYHSSDPKLARRGEVALNLLREYFKLAPVRQGSRIVYKLEPLIGSLAPGDLVAVRLTASGGQWRYLVLEDPIPAGAESVPRDDVYELQNRPPWWQSWYTRREFRDDRVALFQTDFPAGQKQFFHLLKIVNPGIFRVSPARIEPMYQPQVQATTDSALLEVK